MQWSKVCMRPDLRDDSYMKTITNGLTPMSLNIPA